MSDNAAIRALELALVVARANRWEMSIAQLEIGLAVLQGHEKQLAKKPEVAIAWKGNKN